MVGRICMRIVLHAAIDQKLCRFLATHNDGRLLRGCPYVMSGSDFNVTLIYIEKYLDTIPTSRRPYLQQPSLFSVQPVISDYIDKNIFYELTIIYGKLNVVLVI